jgi:SAM-dependent methyltransferase
MSKVTPSVGDSALHPAVTAHMAEVLDELTVARNYRNWLWERTRPHLGRRVLEVGAGLGTMTECIADREAVVALELVPEYVVRLRTKFGTPNIEVIAGDAQDRAVFQSIRGRIDSAMSFNVLEHIGDDRAVLGNVFDSLPPGGRFVCFVPAFPSIYGPMDARLGHVRRYRRKELVGRARDAGFAVRSAEYMNLMGYFAWFLNGRLLRAASPVGGSRALALYDQTGIRVARAMERLVRPPFGQSLIAVFEKPRTAPHP